MRIDTLIGRYFNKRNRRFMGFPEAATGTRLPSADPGKRYLLYLHIPYCAALCPFCSFHPLMQLFSGSLKKVAAEERFGDRFQRILWPELAGLHTIGAIRDANGVLELTESGYYLWVVLMREFFIGVNSLREDMRHNIAVETVILPAR